MMRKVARGVTKCVVCQQVKARYQYVAKLLRPLLVQGWIKQLVEKVFVTGLSRSTMTNDTNWSHS